MLLLLLPLIRVRYLNNIVTAGGRLWPLLALLRCTCLLRRLAGTLPSDILRRHTSLRGDELLRPLHLRTSQSLLLLELLQSICVILLLLVPDKAFDLIVGFSLELLVLRSEGLDFLNARRLWRIWRPQTSLRHARGWRTLVRHLLRLLHTTRRRHHLGRRSLSVRHTHARWSRGWRLRLQRWAGHWTRPGCLILLHESLFQGLKRLIEFFRMRLEPLTLCLLHALKDSRRHHIAILHQMFFESSPALNLLR